MAYRDIITARAAFERSIIRAARGAGTMGDVNRLIDYFESLPPLDGRKRTPGASGAPAHLAIEG